MKIPLSLSKIIHRNIVFHRYNSIDIGLFLLTGANISHSQENNKSLKVLPILVFQLNVDEKQAKNKSFEFYFCDVFAPSRRKMLRIRHF